MAAFLITCGEYYLKTWYEKNDDVVAYWTPFIEDACTDFQTYAAAEEWLSNWQEAGKGHGYSNRRATVITRPTCPRCGKPYEGHPAISREDNKTKICSWCGQDEAIQAALKHKEDHHNA